MSRDHYKGTPKKIRVVKGSDGKIESLSKLSKKYPDYIVADGFITRRPDSLEVNTIYARTFGNDNTGDGSLEKPYRTFVKCMSVLPSQLNNRVWYIDITDLGEEVVEETVRFPNVSSNLVWSVNIDAPITDPTYFGYETPINVFAAPTVIDTLSSPVFNSLPTTSLRTVTDSSKNWIPGEHKQRVLYGDVFNGGVIYDNTEDTLYIAAAYSLTGTLRIVEPSATLKYGAASSLNSFVITGVNSSLTFVGIKFDTHADYPYQSVSVDGCPGRINFGLCVFEKGLALQYGGFATVDYCVIKKLFAQNGTGATVRSSLIKDSTHNVHGGGGTGTNTWQANRVEGSKTPLGHGGNAEPEIGFDYENCSISGSLGTGVVYRGDTMSRVRNCEILNCAGTGVYSEAPGRMRLLNVTGSGNTGYGVISTNGAHVEVTTTTALTGDLGDYKVGVLSPGTWTAFNAGFTNEIDTTAVSGTLSRLFNPSGY